MILPTAKCGQTAVRTAAAHHDMTIKAFCGDIDCQPNTFLPGSLFQAMVLQYTASTLPARLEDAVPRDEALW
eukprot:5244110-Karenia_brevis.AAC.1